MLISYFFPYSIFYILYSIFYASNNPKKSSLIVHVALISVASNVNPIILTRTIEPSLISISPSADTQQSSLILSNVISSCMECRDTYTFSGPTLQKKPLLSDALVTTTGVHMGGG